MAAEGIMTDIEVLIDLLRDFMKNARNEIEGLSDEALAWRPDPGGNSIGMTAWHFARWMDVLGARILQDLPAEQEQWHLQGWAARTGYDPRGIGSRGLGTITGYTQEEAAAVPEMSAADLLAYLDQAYLVAEEQLKALPAGTLENPVPGSAVQGSVYGWLKSLVRGFYGHIGEIQALKAMRERTTREA
jgi:hypothetical protein